jgi:hypothetical protein
MAFDKAYATLEVIRGDENGRDCIALGQCLSLREILLWLSALALGSFMCVPDDAKIICSPDH